MKIGEEIKISRGTAIVIDVQNKDAILLTPGRSQQYILANGIKFNTEADKYEWAYGNYADSLNEIVAISCKKYEKAKDLIQKISECSHDNYIKALISIETGCNNEEELDDAYYNLYMGNSEQSILSDDILLEMSNRENPFEMPDMYKTL